ncbi:MarR family winged helix-turn-helix transcriptional regulator [Desulfosporosinus sp. FKB]|uniref:MarR family winged helix-turn-helix transcriptional regulator n=1 Tax=Desulfosporosinus sp. FKB TaxID=1969835 RepID=UPI0014822388|nr:MarR family winged helix-turn-helix transcriptional regulator [Desulfosporosinus sp. FKB]
MGFKFNSLEWLFPVFDRMHHNCLKEEIVKRGIGEVSNPQILFVLKNEMNNMAASQKELAEIIGISPPTIAISIKRMKKSGLIYQYPDEKDTRRNLIKLSEKGLAYIEECENAFNKVDHAMLKGFTETEREQMKQFYCRMINNLESIGAHPPAQFKKERRTNDGN